MLSFQPLSIILGLALALAGAGAGARAAGRIDQLEIARLESEISSLRAQLDSRPLDSAALAKESMAAQFTPTAATNCYGAKPCLHTSANERLAAGCLEAVWEGQYGKPRKRRRRKTKSGVSGNRSFQQPIAPPRELEPFFPRVGDMCDLADLWAVSPLHRGHIKDAVEAHWHTRLRGLRNALWLSIGSSIDHNWIKVLILTGRNPIPYPNPIPVTLKLNRCSARGLTHHT